MRPRLNLPGTPRITWRYFQNARGAFRDGAIFLVTNGVDKNMLLYSGDRIKHFRFGWTFHECEGYVGDGEWLENIAVPENLYTRYTVLCD